MKFTREMIEKGAWGWVLTKEQMEFIGMKPEKHPLRTYLETNPEISEEDYQKFLAMKPEHMAATRRKESEHLLNAEINKYDSEKVREKRKIVNWKFAPFTKYATNLYRFNRCIKGIKWGLNVEKQLVIIYYHFASFEICCTYKWQDQSVRIERIAENRALIGVVNVEEFANVVKANFPKIKIVVKRK